MNEFKHEIVSYGFDVSPEIAERLENMRDETLAKLEKCGVIRHESEIQEGEYEWVEVLVPSRLYIPIRQIIETFLDSHNANDGNGGWNKLKKNGVKND